jgi:hypothetical protein
LLVHAEDDLLAAVAVMSGIDSLHRMTREERDLDGLILPGSDHLTAYNVYAEAYRRHGYVGEVYGLPRHLFYEEIVEWAARRGVLVKAVEDAALAMASVYRALRLPLPSELDVARDATLRRFQELLARIQPFALVIDEETVDGESARVSKTSVCGSWGGVAGTLRYFADRSGVSRAAIEGTQIPRDLIRRDAVEHAGEIIFDPDRSQSPLVRRRRVTYAGFELEREDSLLREWHGADGPAARHALADALARGVARHPAVRRHQQFIDEIREVWRRSGGTTPRLGLPELTALYERSLDGVNDTRQWLAARISVDWDALVSRDDRAHWRMLPGAAEILERTVPIEYDVEVDAAGAPHGVARLRIPEKMARQITSGDLPELDRPLRFAVHRGPRGSVRANTLEELRRALDAGPADQEERGSGRGGEREGRAGRAGRAGRGGRDARSRKGKPPWRGKPRRGRG